MTGLFFLTLYAGYLGWQWRRVRSLQNEITELKKQVKAVPVTPDGTGAPSQSPNPSPIELKIQELTEVTLHPLNCFSTMSTSFVYFDRDSRIVLILEFRKERSWLKDNIGISTLMLGQYCWVSGLLKQFLEDSIHGWGQESYFQVLICLQGQVRPNRCFIEIHTPFTGGDTNSSSSVPIYYLFWNSHNSPVGSSRGLGTSNAEG